MQARRGLRAQRAAEGRTGIREEYEGKNTKQKKRAQGKGQKRGQPSRYLMFAPAQPSPTQN